MTVRTMSSPPGVSRRVELPPVQLDAMSAAEVVDRVLSGLDSGRGGWIAPVNVDVLRQATRHPSYRWLLQSATLTVADGAPLLWAAWLAGTPLPGRVAGSDLIFSLSEAAAGQGHSVFLLGGAEGVPQRAAARLSQQFDGLKVVGAYAPPVGFEHSGEGLAEVRRRLLDAAPALIFVGLGFPKQERLIQQLRLDLPRSWFLACGAAIPFAAGELVRAPRWMQRVGLEWSHRLLREPRRLAHRYLVQDLPYATHLLSQAAGTRLRPATSDRGRVEQGVGQEAAAAPSMTVGGDAAKGLDQVIDLRDSVRPTVEDRELKSVQNVSRR